MSSDRKSSKAVGSQPKSAAIADVLPRSSKQDTAKRDGESLFLSLVANIPACFLSKDRQGRIVFVNDKFPELMGKPAEEIIGKTVADFYPKDIADAALEEDESVMQTGQVVDDVFEHKTDGQVAYYASRKGPVRNAEGEVVGVQTIFWDITEQRLAEQALVAERDMLQSIMENLPDYVYVKDRDGRYVIVNEAVRKVLNADSIADFIGKSNEDFLPTEQAERERADDEKVISSGEALTNREERMVDEITSEETWLLTSKLPLFDSQGKVMGLVGIDRNITKVKAAAEQMRQAKEAADDANKAKSDFLANMSHEIRTPMNAIIGMTDLLLETQLTKTQREYLSMVQDSGEALLTLINDILDFSKIEAGKFELDCTPFDIRETLGDTMKSLGLRAHDKGLELACRVDSNIPSLRGDPGRIRQIVINLVGNAIKFTDSGEVLLEVECKEGTETNTTLAVAVTDTGIGIAKEHCHRVFEEFEQADASTTRKFGGTGLGLAISSRLVQLMGGKIWVESEIGKGSKFQFEISLEIDSTAKAAVSTEVDIHGVRALVVDDNATNRRILKDMLSNWGMNPTTTSGGAAALQALVDATEEDDPFQVVISDVNMPAMDGLQFAKQVIDGELMKPTGIVMLTSGARTSDVSDLRAMGVNRHLLKPAKQSELYDAVIESLHAAGLASSLVESQQAARALQTTRELQILLAEDNAVNQKLALGILGNLGHHVTIANNGVEALERIEQRQFDLVLMDVQMPEMDGLTATREIRKGERKTQTYLPIVAMTAHAMKGDREYCLASGMDDYLCKPIRLKDMADKLAELFPEENANDVALGGSSFKAVGAGGSGGGGSGGGGSGGGDHNRDDVIPWETALANVNNDNALLCDVVREFLDDTPVLLMKAVEAAGDENVDGLRAAAHSLKGSLLFLEPKDALHCAEQVEQLATEGKLPEARAALDDFHVLFGTVCQSVETYLARNSE